MFARFRTVLAWLLLLALPLQGFAAATMLNCGPNHHRMMSSAMAEVGESDNHMAVEYHEHSTGMTDDHEQAASHAEPSELPSVHHLDKLTKVKCSACAACCMGAAMPTAGLVIASFPPAMTTATFVSTPHVDFLSDGLDRPPRLLLV